MAKDYSFSQKFIEGEVKSGFWNTALYGIVALNSFIIVYFLSVYEYGVYQLILSVVALAESLTVGILDDVIFSDLSRYMGNDNHISAKKLFKEHAFFRIGSSIFLAILVILFSSLISAHYGYNNMAYSISLAVLALPFMASISVMNLFFRSNIYFSSFGAPVFGEVLKIMIIFFLWFWQGLGITQIVISYLAGLIFSFLFAGFHFLRLYKKVFYGVKKSTHGSLIFKLFKEYGAWVFFRYILAKTANNIRPWLIKFFVGTEGLGLFAFARNIFSIIMRLLPFGMFGDLLPRELENKERVRFLFVRMVKYSVWLSFLCAALSFLLLPFLVNMFLPKYNPVAPLLKIMTLIVFLYGFYKIFRITLVVFKEQKTLALKSFDNSVLAPFMLFFLLPLFGVVGAAIEWVITYAVTTVLFYFYLVKAHPYLSLHLKDLLIFDKYDKVFFKKIFQRFLLVFRRV
ncbi:MAG: oligosaccharide flippase family protein [Patescibacteria group bacterium]